jgi:hypothetical protein
MDKDTPNAALVALIAIGYYILSENALDSAFGRGQVKEIFRCALAAGPSVQDTPEWKIAMQHIEEANAAEAAEAPANKELL